ncbi:hypothetical protein WMF38_30040 [Sorangium sp. So ce118]
MRTLRHVFGTLFIGSACAVACSASPSAPPGQGQGTGGSGGNPDDIGAGTGNVFDVGSGGPVEPPPCEVCEDFPAAPVLDDSGTPPPANAPELFGAAGSGAPGGPCLSEPEIGALFPNNWLRPRFRWSAPAGQDLFEIRVHADREKNDLVVYTTNREWKMPKDMWEKLAAHVRDEPITITIRSVSTSAPGAPLLGTSGPITIAPAPAGGSMVYWAAIGEGPADAWLAGFGVGEEGVVDALKVDQVQQGGRRDENGNVRGDGQVRCIGCHTSTPDGEAVMFMDHWPWDLAIASVKEDSVGAVPAYVTPGGSQAMNQDSDIHVVPASGGAATRLAANDPPACLGVTSPGIHNSWPQWSPEATTVDGKTYYWVIFSSSRDGYKLQKDPNKKASQLYVTGVVVEGTTVHTYPAIYLWNQDAGTSNHTPAWDVFKIPPAPVPL